MRKHQASRMLMCLACPKGADAELLHPVLRIPICGGCNAALLDADQAIEFENRVSCSWCGLGDGNELFMCDSCPNSFCVDCVSRNFGDEEASLVRAAPVWTCYCCFPTQAFQSLQIDGDFSYFSIDKAYAAVRPPADMDYDGFDPALAETLTLPERNFASLFTNGLVNSSLQDLYIALEYLTGIDSLSVMFRLSVNLRRFFKSKIFLMPGLFKTAYGLQNQCRLHYHQLVGLNYMTRIENRTSEFDALRGGIFGDEPGLGKTVTCLALIASTAGTRPQQPEVFWDRGQLEEHWRLLRGQYTKMLLPSLNRLGKIVSTQTGLPVGPGGDAEALRQLIRHLDAHCDTLAGFESKVRSVIQRVAGQDRAFRDKMAERFQIELMKIKEGLDSKKRKVAYSQQVDTRIRFERALIPSSGTLIIVPQTLLEHWYEQIKRHLCLSYYSYDEGCRGVVYMDGLGDIMDVVPPISKFMEKTGPQVTSRADELSHFMIVVTTFERCKAEFEKRRKLFGKLSTSNSTAETDSESLSAVNMTAKELQAFGADPLLGVRWLRLVVDEGHEIGQLSRTKTDRGALAKQLQSCIESSTSDLNKFIAQIAAERRWIMSGTPTTGANSEVGLTQMFRLLSFLRHPLATTLPEAPTKRRGRKSLPASESTASLASVSVKDEAEEEQEPPVVPTAKPEKFSSCAEHWVKKWVLPCLQQQEGAWEALIDLLRQLLVRHTKNDLRLFDPIASTANLERMPRPGDEEEILAVDRAKASHIATTLWSAIADWKAHVRANGRRSFGSPLAKAGGNSRSSFGAYRSSTEEVGFNNRVKLSSEEQDRAKMRQPKAIVFSQNKHDLQGVGHFLYTMMGDAQVCEHFGKYRSTELSRFRHSKRKYKGCPLCGFANTIDADKHCGQTLVAVEYLDVVPVAEGDERPPPTPSGHGAAGAGGHFTGKCLCSPAGCITPVEQATCCRYPNAFNAGFTIANPNVALVPMEQIEGWTPGDNVVADAVVRVMPLAASNDPGAPLLWRDGIMGGRAVVRYWRGCGGSNVNNSWHGCKVLENVPWKVEEQPASVLLLEEDGSTGLDLSFATHIFLLERVKDPALKRQIVSRAHRMGATGPVRVTLVQVRSEDQPAGV